jgi:hypothetical protein
MAAAMLPDFLRANPDAWVRLSILSRPSAVRARRRDTSARRAATRDTRAPVAISSPVAQGD